MICKNQNNNRSRSITTNCTYDSSKVNKLICPMSKGLGGLKENIYAKEPQEDGST